MIAGRTKNDSKNNKFWKKKIESVTFELDKENLYKLSVYMSGSQDSIYEGGRIKILCFLLEKYSISKFSLNLLLLYF